MRNAKMGHLFALLAKASIGNDQRHGWARDTLNRPVETFRSLTEQEIQMLIDELELPEQDPADHDGTCGEFGPDDQPCVLNQGHGLNGADVECVGADGEMWVLR